MASVHCDPHYPKGVWYRLQTREDVTWQLQRLGPRPAQDTVLEILEASDAALKQATNLHQAGGLSDIAEVLRACAQKLDMAKVVQDDAAAFAIRAEHRYNELIQAARKRGEIAEGTRGQLRGRKPTGEPSIIAPRPASGVPDSPPEKPPLTLAQIGIDKPKAKRLRRWTGIGEQELEELIEEKRKIGKLTKTAVLGDPKPKNDALRASRYFLALLKDFAEHPDHYDAESLAGDEKLLALYQVVRGQFLSFLKAFDSRRPHAYSGTDRSG